MVLKDDFGFELNGGWLRGFSEGLGPESPRKIDLLKGHVNLQRKSSVKGVDVKGKQTNCRRGDAENSNTNKRVFRSLELVRRKGSLHEQSISCKRVPQDVKTGGEFRKPKGAENANTTERGFLNLKVKRDNETNFDGRVRDRKLSRKEKTDNVYIEKQDRRISECRFNMNNKGIPNKRPQHPDIAYREQIRGCINKFQDLVSTLQHERESSKGNTCRKSDNKIEHKRVDLMALELLRVKETRLPPVKWRIGEVPGVEIGDEFHYRVELRLAGLHRHLINGIDSMVYKGVQVATCIVSTVGGYSDTMENSDVLIYEGEGGHPSFQSRNKNPREDAKLSYGNLALKNSITTQTPVRVVHGFKDRKGRPIYVYDGLYLVEDIWMEIGKNGSSLFKFRLRRKPGQPLLVLKDILLSKRLKGQRKVDFSRGKVKRSKS